jgi:predicted amidohydrolase YtcJ
MAENCKNSGQLSGREEGARTMVAIDRRNAMGLGLAGAAALWSSRSAQALTESLSDIGASLSPAPQATIYTAREIVTLDPAKPAGESVAVVNGRILWVGNLDEVVGVLGDQPYTIDRTFEAQVIVPGFVAQHDHPVLAALTMSSEILSIEDWVLPGRTIPAVKDKADFIARLTAAVRAEADPAKAILTWGYHSAFFGPLTRADLDAISAERPIIVWARSCHEMILNGAALARGKVTKAVWDGFSTSARKQSNFDEGRFWEQGLFAVLPFIASMVASPEQLRAGLELTRDYMHSKGVTIGNEPGGILSKPVQDGVNAVFSSPDMPFRWSFMADGKSMVAKSADDAEVIAASEDLASWYGGMTSLAQRQAKLFADGAIYSQLMQVREPYLDRHTGEWMMDEDAFARAFRIYWDAGYQLHIHVNGDAGLDRVLDTLEANLRRNPRFDHRTVLVHFAVSAPDQVARIRALGAIVSGNPYYVAALADQYGKVGLGPVRADEMVRLGDVTRAGISWSLHSDMPMAPGDPLFLMWCAVNRLTTSGRVAGPEQRVTAEAALRGVTIEAAYSLKLENEVGSITPGKRANLTILADNPLTVAADRIKDIKVWGTVMEGRVLPVDRAMKKTQRDMTGETRLAEAFAADALDHALKVIHAHNWDRPRMVR